MDLPTRTPQLLRVPEVAERLRVSPRTVWRWVASGQLPCVRLGGADAIVRIDVEALEQYLHRRRRHENARGEPAGAEEVSPGE